MKKLCGFALFCFSAGMFVSCFFTGFAARFLIIVLSIVFGYLFFCTDH